MPNDSTSGFTDEQLQQIRNVALEVANASTGQVTDFYSQVSGAMLSSLEGVVSDSVTSAIENGNAATQTVALAGDQWESLSGYVVLSRDSVRLQNSVMLLELLLVAAIIGVLFFGHFSKGFRRD